MFCKLFVLTIWLVTFVILPADQDPLSKENEALFAKIGHRVLATEALSPKIAHHPPRQGIGV